MLTTKICPRCGHEVKGGASFCDRCGMQLGSATVSTDPTLDVAVSWTRRLVVPILICAIVALAAVILILQKKLDVTTQQLALAEETVKVKAAAPVQPPPNPLPAPTPPQTPDNTANASNDPGQYVAFLKDIDRRRLALLAVATHAPAGVTDTNAPQDPGQAWQSLDQDFHAVQPPSACNAAAAAYASLLTDCAAYATHSASNPYAPSTPNATTISPSELTADAARADAEVGKVCQAYSIPKPFTINSVP